MSSWSDGTRVVRGGDGPVVPGAPLRPSPVFAAPYHLGEDPYAADFYARHGFRPAGRLGVFVRP